MNIVEATQKALEKGVGITNTSFKKIECYLLPTNTKECYMIVPIGYSHTKKRRTAARWNPHAADILADDWEITEGET